jgi:uncharacterized protein (DUF302 family)
MRYVFSRILALPFAETVARTRKALATEGFGVITEIDLRETLKAKLGVDFRPYLILGACNPSLAYEALKLEPNVGAMLPCNVVVQEHGDGATEVSAVDPVASMQAIDNPQLKIKAQAVGDRLQAAISRI